MRRLLTVLALVCAAALPPRSLADLNSVGVGEFFTFQTNLPTTVPAVSTPGANAFVPSGRVDAVSTSAFFAVYDGYCERTYYASSGSNYADTATYGPIAPKYFWFHYPSNCCWHYQNPVIGVDAYSSTNRTMLTQRLAEYDNLSRLASEFTGNPPNPNITRPYWPTGVWWSTSAPWVTAGDVHALVPPTFGWRTDHIANLRSAWFNSCWRFENLLTTAGDSRLNPNLLYQPLHDSCLGEPGLLSELNYNVGTVLDIPRKPLDFFSAYESTDANSNRYPRSAYAATDLANATSGTRRVVHNRTAALGQILSLYDRTYHDVQPDVQSFLGVTECNSTMGAHGISAAVPVTYSGGYYSSEVGVAFDKIYGNAMTWSYTANTITNEYWTRAATSPRLIMRLDPLRLSMSVNFYNNLIDTFETTPSNVIRNLAWTHTGTNIVTASLYEASFIPPSTFQGSVLVKIEGESTGSAFLCNSIALPSNITVEVGLDAHLAYFYAESTLGDFPRIKAITTPGYIAREAGRVKEAKLWELDTYAFIPSEYSYTALLSYVSGWDRQSRAQVFSYSSAEAAVKASCLDLISKLRSLATAHVGRSPLDSPNLIPLGASDFTTPIAGLNISAATIITKPRQSLRMTVVEQPRGTYTIVDMMEGEGGDWTVITDPNRPVMLAEAQLKFTYNSPSFEYSPNHTPCAADIPIPTFISCVDWQWQKLKRE